MSYAVQHLIEGRGLPLSVTSDDPVRRALDLMWKNDYSQLPVVDEENRPLGMITHASILDALRHFGPDLDGLPVSSAATKCETFRPDDDLFDLLDELKQQSALLIVDGAGKLTGIVTGYDSTEYFRRRSEDMMRVRDVEIMLKDLIRAAFSDISGRTDEAELSSAVAAVTGPRLQLQGRYRAALQHFLKIEGREDAPLEQKDVDASFAILMPPEKPKSFERLTLQEYIDLLLHRDRHAFCRQALGFDPSRARSLLEGVRDTRNKLAHFRDDEITSAEREQLQFCSDWLNRIVERLRRHQQPVLVEWPMPSEPSEPLPESEAIGPVEVRTETAVDQSEFSEVEPLPDTHAVAPIDVVGEIAPEHDVILAPLDEVVGPNDSRYAALALWLQSRPRGEDRVQLSFEQLEGLICSKLPPSARQHRSWWANDSVGHVQSQQWLDAGWRVSYLNMTEEHVTFARVREREKAYIDFFSALDNDLARASGFPLKAASPDGQNWHWLATLPKRGPQQLYISATFARGRRFRIELYIDIYNEVKNKAIFDQLIAEARAIEATLEAELGWERLPERRASRIAWYRNGAITDGEKTLSEIRIWAADAAVRFFNALAEPVEQALIAVQATN